MPDQARWNRLGADRLAELAADPDAHRIDISPIGHWDIWPRLLEILSPLPGRRILDVGCGRGDLAVWLAQQGAVVSAVDLGDDLVHATRALAARNGVAIDARVGSATALPFPDSAFDAVIGLGVLHHLPDPKAAVTEARRVAPLAVFHEPVENVRAFHWLQTLIPVGRSGDHDYRPSRLRRAAFASWLAAQDERDLTDRELRSYADGLFPWVRLTNYGLTVRLARLVGGRETLKRLDRRLFRLCPPLRRLAQNTLAEYMAELQP